MTDQSSADTSSDSRSEGPDWLANYRWVPFVAPFAVYMLLGSLEPSAPAAADVIAAVEPDAGVAAPAENWLGLRYEHYPAVYTAKVVVTFAVLFAVWPVYRQWPLRVSPLAIGVGVVGVILWVAISHLGIEERIVAQLGADNWLVAQLGLGPRPAYNPLEELAGQSGLAYGFLAIRFLGLALLVPIIEEMFLRAWMMRVVVHQNWWAVPFGEVTRLAVVMGTLVPVLYHPEKMAALVWFTLITWLMVRNKNIWDCIAAHAVTNLLLGIWVVTTGDWKLW